MKGVIAIGIAILLVLSFGSPNTALAPMFSEKHVEDVENNSISSFHNKVLANWYAIKIHSASDIHIKELHFCQELWSEETRGFSQGFVIANLTTYYYRSAGVLVDWSEKDKFFHFHIGPINFTYEDLVYTEDFHGGWGIRGSFTLPSGTWYLIALGQTFKEKANKSEMEVWINTSSDIDFLGETKGNDTFAYSSIDFLANLNMYWGGETKIGCIINGKKSIKVNNTFITSICSGGSGVGIEKIKIFNSEEIYKTVIIYKGKHGISTIGDDLFFMPFGGKGIWNYRISYLKISMNPQTFFIIGDIKLP